MSAYPKRAFSLVGLSFIAIGIFAVSSLIAIAALTGVQSSSQQAVTSWRVFADQASTEQRALRAFVTQAGMGGLVDEYHKFAATGDETLIPMIYGRGGGALAALATYPAEDPESEEGQARSQLQSLVRGYMARIGPLTAMHRAGRPLSEIIAASNIGTDTAIDALETLAEATQHSMMSGASFSDSKSLVLLDVRRLLGLEGLVQNANRYLTGPRAASYDRLRSSLAGAQHALERYERLGITADERLHLDTLRSALANIDTSLAAQRNAQIAVFDSNGLQAPLIELEKSVYAEAMTAQANMQSTLEEVSGRAGMMMLLVVAGAFFLIAGAIWLLVFHIGGRINAITSAMRHLSQGKLDAEIPGNSDQDEIGEMSRALVVFRDGMRANAALTAELAESSRLASLGAMVAGMAHELNTPIGNALAVSSMLEDQCKSFRKDLNSERLLRSVLERHASNLEEAATLIQRNLVRAGDQIGSFKQVAVDQTSGKCRPFQIDDILANVVQSLQPTFKRTPFTLTLGEPSGVTMESYPGALSQVVTNLVENGLRHGLAGHVAGNVAIEVVRKDADTTEISVTDDGAGIPEEILPSIFNAFFTTKDGAGGSGLGLHIVKSIVCGQLGGQIDVESRPARGARFVITLPNRAPAGAAGAETTERIYYAAAQHAA
jgi:signal transduction histidine kinase